MEFDDFEEDETELQSPIDTFEMDRAVARALANWQAKENRVTEAYFHEVSLLRAEAKKLKDQMAQLALAVSSLFGKRDKDE